MKIIVKENDVGLRLDNFLKKIFSDLSLSRIYKLIRLKKVKINKQKTTFNYRLCLHDQIDIFLPKEMIEHGQHDPQLPIFMQVKHKLDVIYEDANILLVYKPVNLLVYDEKNKEVNTLINWILKYLTDTGQWNYTQENQFVPCLIHRLDFNTQGLMLAAKNHEAAKILFEKMKQREIKKYYQCIVHGPMPEQTQFLQHYWRKNDQDNIVTIQDYPFAGSQLIKTRYWVLNYDKKTDQSILKIELITGKTHQIRSHLAHIKHPLVGEQKYSLKKFKNRSNWKHQALISYLIGFTFTTSAGKLDYLNSKQFCLPNKFLFSKLTD